MHESGNGLPIRGHYKYDSAPLCFLLVTRLSTTQLPAALNLHVEMALSTNTIVLECPPGSGALKISFHRATRVPDHEDPAKQIISPPTIIDHSPSCELTPWPGDGDDRIYLLALDCAAGLALDSMSIPKAASLGECGTKSDRPRCVKHSRLHG